MGIDFKVLWRNLWNRIVLGKPKKLKFDPSIRRFRANYGLWRRRLEMNWAMGTVSRLDFLLVWDPIQVLSSKGVDFMMSTRLEGMKDWGERKVKQGRRVRVFIIIWVLMLNLPKEAVRRRLVAWGNRYRRLIPWRRRVRLQGTCWEAWAKRIRNLLCLSTLRNLPSPANGKSELEEFEKTEFY